MELVFFLKIFSYLILFFIILLGIAKVISIFINYLPKLHSELFALRSKLVKKKYQHWFYAYERFNKTPTIFGKRYFKLNNYLFRIGKQNNKINKKISQIIIVLYSKSSKYFNYLFNNTPYSRPIDNKSVNFFKIQVPKNKSFKFKTNNDDIVLKTFYINKSPKRKLVLILLFDGLSNYFSKQLTNSNRFFGKSNKLENMWSNSAWTLPTWSNLITGMYTSNHLNYEPRSFYNSNPKFEKLSSSVKSKSTIFEFFKKNNFITASYSPYVRINPTYNFDRGVDIMKFCENESTDEIVDNIISHIEMFNNSSNFIVAHMMDLHHVSKGFKRITDYSNFPEENYNYNQELKKERVSNRLNKRDEFVKDKSFYEEQDLHGIIKSSDLRLKNLYNYLSDKKFEDYTILLLGDHGTRLKKFNEQKNILSEYHQNVGLFIKDKKIKSFASKKNKLIETIDIFPSLVARYSNNLKNISKKQFDGQNTIFSNTKKDYHLAESIYTSEYNLLINCNNNYSYSSYEFNKDKIKKKINTKFYNNKHKRMILNKEDKLFKKLDTIEKKHLKKSKI